MLNWRQIIRVLGLLLFIEAGQLLITLLVALFYKEDPMPYVWPIILSIGLGGLAQLAGIGGGKTIGRRDGYVIVTFVWILFTLIGTLPFMLTKSVPDWCSAFFESMSGFTSTGSTIIDDIDHLPRGIIFWRSMTQWIGGIGIIFFTIAVLPAFGVGEVKLFAAESTGPLHDKIHPRISVAVKWIGMVYLGLTCLCIVSLVLCGMSLFDAINISMTTTATGGFAPHSAMFHDVWNSPSIEYVTSVFMFFSGVNYTLIYYSILKGKISRFFQNPECRCYIIIVASAVLICTIGQSINLRVDSLAGFEESFRNSLFTIISLQTTTGYASTDYTLWHQALMPIILFVMFAGACSGSTSGGFKCIRWAILWQVITNEFKRILHPRAVIPVKLNDEVIAFSVQKTLLAFISLFVGALFLGAILLVLLNMNINTSYTEAFSLSLSSLSNVGPAMDYYGPAHSWAIISPASKILCSMLMLIGRLEIFPIFILFTHNFWKKE